MGGRQRTTLLEIGVSSEGSGKAKAARKGKAKKRKK